MALHALPDVDDLGVERRNGEDAALLEACRDGGPLHELPGVPGSAVPSSSSGATPNG